MDNDDDELQRKDSGLPFTMFEHDSSRTFSLVIAFADTTTRNRALALYDRLAQGLLRDCEFQCRWFQFEDFKNHQIRQHAADLTAAADMIILALRDGPEIPPHLGEWLESWLPRAERNSTALVTLIASGDTSASEISPLQMQLESLAREAQVDFFVHYFDEPTSTQPRTATRAPSYLEEDDPRQQPPRSGWGLNE